MGFVIKAFGLILVLGAAGLVGYSLLADLSPPQADIVLPVQLNVD